MCNNICLLSALKKQGISEEQVIDMMYDCLVSRKNRGNTFYSSRELDDKVLNIIMPLVEG